MEKSLDSILNTDHKIKILRLFICRTEEYQATGREVARLINVTAPTAHAALKDLHGHHIIQYEVSGRNHLYRLNRKNRTVMDLLLPMFSKEQKLQKDAFDFLIKMIDKQNIKKRIISIIFYGSRKTQRAHIQSDIDIAIVVKTASDVEPVENVFIDNISCEFYEYFGFSIDAYIKSKKDFINRLKLKKAPVSTLMRAYDVILGEDPLFWK